MKRSIRRQQITRCYASNSLAGKPFFTAYGCFGDVSDRGQRTGAIASPAYSALKSTASEQPVHTRRSCGARRRAEVNLIPHGRTPLGAITPSKDPRWFAQRVGASTSQPCCVRQRLACGSTRPLATRGGARRGLLLGCALLGRPRLPSSAFARCPFGAARWGSTRRRASFTSSLGRARRTRGPSARTAACCAGSACSGIGASRPRFRRACLARLRLACLLRSS